MDELSNHPYAQIIDAMRTVVGRIVLGVAAIAFGAFLGGLTATNTWSGGLDGVLGFHYWIIPSIFTTVGIIALPATLLFLILFPRTEWPLWTVLIATLLIWWNTHKTIHWLLHNSAPAKLQKIVDDANEQVAKQLQEERKRNENIKAQRE